MNGSNSRLIALVLALPLLICGCGGDPFPPRAAVSGTVTLDGAPLSQGVVRFVPVGGSANSKWSIPIANGEFSAEKNAGPAIGEHRIEIESTDTGGFELDDEDALGRLSAERRKVKVVKVPPWYGTSSRLKETVAEDGPNEFTFALSSKRS